MNLKYRLKELKYRLKELKNRLTLHKTKENIPQILNYNNKEKSNFDITILENYDLFKIEITDYITASDYLETMKQIDIFELNSKLTNGILWNSNKQRINKGVYFVFFHNGKLYNILNNENFIKIDERIKIEDTIEEKILTFKIEDANYYYFKCIHDKNGNSYLTRYYGKNGTICADLELSIEEFKNDLNLIFSSLETLKDIESIIDIEIISQQIFEDLSKKNIRKKK